TDGDYLVVRSGHFPGAGGFALPDCGNAVLRAEPVCADGPEAVRDRLAVPRPRMADGGVHRDGPVPDRHKRGVRQIQPEAAGHRPGAGADGAGGNGGGGTGARPLKWARPLFVHLRPDVVAKTLGEATGDVAGAPIADGGAVDVADS